MSETLLTCPDCGQENFSPKGLKTHQGGKTCQRRAAQVPLSEVTVEAPDSRQLAKTSGDSPDVLKGVSLVSHLEGLNGGEIIRWLERAVPAYEQARTQSTLMGLSIGYALLIVRDFSPRGSLTTLKKLQAFGRSARTLDRCIKLAQTFITAKGLADEKTGKLANPENAGAFFQEELDFGEARSLANPLLAEMSSFVGQRTMTELLDSDLLGEDDDTAPPNNHQQDSSKKRSKETPEGIRREAFKRAFKQFSKSFHAHEWICLYQRGEPDLVKVGLDVGTLDLETFLMEALALVSAHNKEAATKARKGGKSE